MPVLYNVYNYSDESEDYGRFLMVIWSDAVVNAMTNLANFKLVDAYSISYYPSAIYETGYPNRYILEFANFNNASNPISCVYTPGTLSWLNSALVDASSKTFDAIGLVPTFIPAPIVVSISNSDNRTILIEFDRPIINIDAGINLSILGFEPEFSPLGVLIPTTYAIETITLYDAYTVQVYLTYAGRLKHPQGNLTVLYTNGLTGPGPTAVAGFSEDFLPVVSPIWVKPHAPEYINVGISNASINAFDVIYSSAQNGDENLKVSMYGASIVVTNVGGLPL